jgi:phosphatidylserine/phosphatidylglycerophosphate/cardiolipin synthase-like enzyme
MHMRETRTVGDSPKPEDFFLPAKDETDDVKFLPPLRQGNKVEPLIDGVAFFTAVEEAMAIAKESIYCAIWNIYPDTPLLSKKVMTSLKVKDWQGLLTTVAKTKQVKVRLLLSDFDPILDNSHHQRAWRGYNTFVENAVKAGLTHDQFQVFPSLHPASFAASFVAHLLAKRALQGTIDGLNRVGLKGLENSPGIWPFMTLKGKRLKMIGSPSFNISPASHHQKTLVIDNKIGFVGGINISDFYQNTPEHLGNHRAHDIFCRVEGPVVKDIERNFVGRWNAESPSFNAFVTAVNGVKLGRQKIKTPLTITSLLKSNAALAQQGNALAQVHRTLSSSISGSFPNLMLRTERDDVKQTYDKVISLANDYIYIENQYVRVVGVADAMIKRFKANKKLQVIIVVPVIPEEIEEGAGDPLTLHGVFLQHEALTRLRSALGANLGLYSLVQNKKAPADQKSKSLSSFGSLRIYPHSKVLIVDDVFASIGSANVNPRSFELDSEIDLGWHEASSVKAFREQLWKEHLGSPDGSLFATWKVQDYVKEWDAIAKKNTTMAPASRQGFIVPHDPDAAKGSQQSLPDFLAGLGTTGREDRDTQLA